MAAVPPLPEGWEERRDQQVSLPEPFPALYFSVACSSAERCVIRPEKWSAEHSNFPVARNTSLRPSPCTLLLSLSLSGSLFLAHPTSCNSNLFLSFVSRATRTTLITSRGKHHGATPSFKAIPHHHPPTTPPPHIHDNQPPQRPAAVVLAIASSTALPTARYATWCPRFRV